jgi:glucosyl-3-phosphoglycerate synthase
MASRTHVPTSVDVVLTQTAAWFERASSRWTDWALDSLCAAKGRRRISVVIPARDEEATIAGIVEGIRAQLMERHPLVDELVVMDSDSLDATAVVAAEHGAQVHAVRSVRPDLGEYGGKGEALWKSLFVTSGELLVFIDADLTEWGPHFVSGLLGPLLADPAVDLVKGYYDRVLDAAPTHHGPQGGRVTELVARPLLNLGWPELAAVVQPLAGEWAVRRAAIEQQSVPVGYGVELAVLLDVWTRSGLPALAQVDLGSRAHAHQSVHDLGVMAAEILQTAASRSGSSRAVAEQAQLWQFDRDRVPPWQAREVPLAERPPALSINGYPTVAEPAC